MNNPDDIWLSPPSDLALEQDEVHIWRVSLEQPISIQNALLPLLAPDERARFDRMKIERVRRQYLTGRGVLRVLLGHYLKVPPEEIVFEYNDYGKPQLSGVYTNTGICFNLSHSHTLALYAVTCHREIGVDLEYQRSVPLEERMQIARRFFSNNEYEALSALPVHQRQEAFYRTWTRKEAFIKADGQGLSLSLSEFDVSVAPNTPAALLSTRWDPEEAARWSLYALTPGEGYQGAIVLEGKLHRLMCWQWSSAEMER